MSDIEFVDGMIVKPPHERAPDFVKLSIAIKRKDLGNWLRGKNDDWINIQVKESRSGKWYAEVDNWKPDADKQTQHDQAKANGYAPQDDDFDADKIPF